MAEMAAKQVNKKYLPKGAKICCLLHINNAIIIVLIYCLEAPLRVECVPQPYTPSILLVYCYQFKGGLVHIKLWR